MGGGSSSRTSPSSTERAGEGLHHSQPDYNETINEAIARYRREKDRYAKLTEAVFETCKALVAQHGIRAAVQRRTKEETSLREKLEKWKNEDERRSRLASDDTILESTKDLAGVRITTYLESDRQAVVDLLESKFAGPSGKKSPAVDIKDKTPDHFYRATHCQVVIRSTDLEEDSNLADLPCEIQVCSLLAHVWNEIEHDLGYKPVDLEIDNDEKLALQQLGHITMAGDIAIQTLLGTREKRLAGKKKEKLAPAAE